MFHGFSLAGVFLRTTPLFLVFGRLGTIPPIEKFNEMFVRLLIFVNKTYPQLSSESFMAS